MPELEEALKSRRVKVLKRPPGRNVVFEVPTPRGNMDVGRWRNVEREKERDGMDVDSPVTPVVAKKKGSMPKPSVRINTRAMVVDSDSDEDSDVDSDQPTKIPVVKRKVSTPARRNVIGERIDWILYVLSTDNDGCRI
jgi:hypothetical protein